MDGRNALGMQQDLKLSVKKINSFGSLGDNKENCLTDLLTRHCNYIKQQLLIVSHCFFVLLGHMVHLRDTIQRDILPFHLFEHD